MKWLFRRLFKEEIVDLEAVDKSLQTGKHHYVNYQQNKVCKSDADRVVATNNDVTPTTRKSLIKKRRSILTNLSKLEDKLNK